MKREPLDTTLRVVTPENIAFDFQLAGPAARAVAFGIDMAMLGALLFVCILLFMGLNLNPGFFLLLLFALWWGYGGVMETFWNGQTLGKKAMGLRTVSASGLTINGQQAMLRNILQTADLFPPFFPGLLAMAFSTRFQRLGDMAAGTMVIMEHVRRRPLVTEDDVPEKLRRVDDLIPKTFQPDRRLMDVLAGYASRRIELSKPRRIELARILAGEYVRRWELPRDTDPDLLLYAMYRRGMFEKEEEEAESRQRTRRRVKEAVA